VAGGEKMRVFMSGQSGKVLILKNGEMDTTRGEKGGVTAGGPIAKGLTEPVVLDGNSPIRFECNEKVHDSKKIL